MYVVIEGIDTAGKSTQIDALRPIFPDALFTKEPGATEVGAKIREIVLHHEVQSARAEMLLFLADRAEHLDTVVRPNASRLVVSDRSLVSGIAYAKVQGLFSDDELIELNRFATGGLLPDLVIILTLTPEELRRRLEAKTHDAIESRGTDYLLAIQDALVQSAQMLNIRSVVVDATQSIETIGLTIQQTIKGEL